MHGLRSLLSGSDRGNVPQFQLGTPDVRAVRRVVPGLRRRMRSAAGSMGLGRSRLPARHQGMLRRGGGVGTDGV